MARPVIEIEDAERARRSLKRRLDHTCQCRIDTPQKCDRSLVEELFSLAFIEEAANVGLIGSNGLGKTMLLKNLAHQAVLHGHTARFTLASDMLHDLAAKDSTTALARRLRRYTSPTILAIDEVGYWPTFPGWRGLAVMTVLLRRHSVNPRLTAHAELSSGQNSR